MLHQRLMARDVDRQVAEIMVRAAVLTGYTALGTPGTDGRRIGLSGNRGNPAIKRFVQHGSDAQILSGIHLVNPVWQLGGMSRPTPPIYRTKNWPAYNAALKRRGSLTIWFDPAMTWDAAPTGKRGLQPDCSDASIQTCLAMKGEGRPEVCPADRFQP